jgi:hypothetical protein
MKRIPFHSIINEISNNKTTSNESPSSSAGQASANVRLPVGTGSVVRTTDAFTKRGTQLAAARKDDRKENEWNRDSQWGRSLQCLTDVLKVLGHIIEHGDDVVLG